MDRFKMPSRRVQITSLPSDSYVDDDDGDSDDSLDLVEPPPLRPSKTNRRINVKPPSSSSLSSLDTKTPTTNKSRLPSLSPSPPPPPPVVAAENIDNKPPPPSSSSSSENNNNPLVVTTEDQEPFMGMKVRRKASFHRNYKGDYLHVPSNPSLMRILDKQGDRQVLFADKVLKFTESGKMKQRILLITDFAIYIVDPESSALKRRIALAAVDKLCLSELSDNFFAIIVPSEYDCLMASIRKSEIVTVLGQATESTSEYELQVVFSNSFEYHAAAEIVKEVRFEEVEGGVRTRIVRK